MPKLEKLIPLPQAARRLGLSQDVLTRLVDSGIIKANEHEGRILIPESEIRQTITREQFQKLRGTPITVTEAEEKYGISNPTISKWARLGYIKIIRPGYGMQLDESDMAYCAAIYKARNGRRGSRVFDEAGRPYELKRPEVAAYRQRKAKEARAHA